MVIEATALLDTAFEVELPPAPYPGLRPFEKHEWPIFFGREQMTHEVIHRLIQQHLVVVHGDSGCGKSSLIRAGVLAQLEQEHARSGVRWRVCAMLPREAPLKNLASALAKLEADEPDRNRIRQIRRCLNLGRDAPGALAELLRGGSDDHICILVDQFEELFSFARKHGREDAQQFTDILVGLQENPPPGLYGVVTMRSEFLGVCARFKGLAEAVNKVQYLLPQMDRPALLRAICEPAALYDGEVSRELAERLIADAGGGQDQLPLIQHGLTLLWRGKTSARTLVKGLAETEMAFGMDDAATPFRHQSGPVWRLGLEDYRGAGGLADLLSAHADEVMAAVAPDTMRKRIVEHIFRALTDINAEGSAVRRPQALADLMAVTGSNEQALKEIIDRFRAEGTSFLTPYGDTPIDSKSQVDISHEALIRCWRKIAEPNTGWVHREFQDGHIWKILRIHAQEGERLSAAATTDRGEWLESLPSQAWCKRYGGGWDDVRQLLLDSRKALEEAAKRRHDEEEAKRRQAEERAAEAAAGQRRATRLATIAGALALVAIAGATTAIWFGFESHRNAESAERARVSAETNAIVARFNAKMAEDEEAKAGRQRDQALRNESLFRTEQAQNALNQGLPFMAMRLALAGLPEDPSAADARPWIDVTAGALVQSLGRERSVIHNAARVLAAAFSPDGRRIVSGSSDNMVRVWDAASGEELLVLRGHEERVWAAAFSPDGARIVSGSDDQTVRVWDAASGKELLVLRGHERDVFAAAFSPAGDRIVSGSLDATVRVWNLASDMLMLAGHEGAVNAARFSPDGAAVVSGSDDGTIRVWNFAGGEKLLVSNSDEGRILAAGFSPRGDRIVCAATSWLDMRRSEDLDRESAEKSGDDFDGAVQVWDAASGKELLVLRGHEGRVYAAAFSPDGARIVSGGNDKTVRVWDAASGKELMVLRGHEGPVYAAAFSPDGARIVSASADKTVRVWDAASGKELLVLQGHEGAVWAAAFSSDGARIVSGSEDKTLRVWDAASGKELLVLRGHEGPVYATAFSPDGARIVSGSEDRTVRVWNATSGEKILALRAHNGPVRTVDFSPDGAHIVSGSDDQTVRETWIGRTKQELIETARAGLPRELTEEERRRFYLTTE